MDPIKNVLNKIISIVEKEKNTFNEPTVEGGTMGVAIFYYFCHQYFNDDQYLYKAEEMVEKSINLISAISEQDEFVPKYTGDSLSNVIASFGKGLLFIENKFNYDYDFSSYYEVISETLQVLVAEDIKRKDYDFFSGALSSAYFFLNKLYYSRGEDGASFKNLEKIYENSKKASVHLNENEIYWVSPSYLDQVYLGLSHGSAMMINFWSKLYKLNIINSENKEEKLWLNKAVNFIFERKRDFVDGYFPHKAFSTEIAGKTQLSMCYGDLGVLYSLFNANQILENPIYQKAIDEMIYTTSLRDQEPLFTYDTGILYGASGIGYIFEYFSGEKKQNIYENTINYWNNQILTYRTSDNDFVYGFKDDKNKSAKHSFAWGISGMGIRLMQSQSSQLPSINELLLIGI
ncbi:lanthionine synthetase LanC family protein [Chryseobacterium sp. PMSZPI]|uniref:lanthionine synthetase LanC family protein n=1 Tax=Chryseobacterium sp. PMSZPI TaxID=1033900 RepID=UPI0039A3929C